MIPQKVEVRLGHPLYRKIVCGEMEEEGNLLWGYSWQVVTEGSVVAENLDLPAANLLAYRLEKGIPR